MRNEKPSPRAVLSHNLKALMRARPELGTIRKVAAASRSKLSNGKLGRIYAASHTTDIDALQDLADVFGLSPWQLLVEDLNPAALPRLADATVLHQILDAVTKTGLAEPQPNGRQSSSSMGTALQKATDLRELGRESHKSGSASKPRSGRGSR